MSIITIISHPPRPGSARTTLDTEDRKDFPTKAEAIAYLESLPDPDALPSGDGTSES